MWNFEKRARGEAAGESWKAENGGGKCQEIKRLLTQSKKQKAKYTHILYITTTVSTTTITTSTVELLEVVCMRLCVCVCV